MLFAVRVNKNERVAGRSNHMKLAEKLDELGTTEFVKRLGRIPPLPMSPPPALVRETCVLATVYCRRLSRILKRPASELRTQEVVFITIPLPTIGHPRQPLSIVPLSSPPPIYNLDLYRRTNIETGHLNSDF